MSIIRFVAIASFFLMSVKAGEGTHAQHQQPNLQIGSRGRSSRVVKTGAPLTGVYRIDIASSDKLYSVVAGAKSNLPLGEQPRFFLDFAIRLTPPDMLAIDQRGRTISIASSRAARINFDADGVARTERTSDGNVIRTHATINGDQLSVNTSGSGDDRFNVTFERIENGRRLRVTRRIYAQQLTQPIVIQSIYNKISEVADWRFNIEREATAPAAESAVPPATVDPASSRSEDDQALVLRDALDDWIAATNLRDLETVMAYYMPRVKAYYLTRNVSQAFVRADKARALREADSLKVFAHEPEIIFPGSSQTAIMRFRKPYVIKTRSRERSGEVIQELRWQRTREGWKIVSERDIKVIR